MLVAFSEYGLLEKNIAFSFPLRSPKDIQSCFDLLFKVDLPAEGRTLSGYSILSTFFNSMPIYFFETLIYDFPFSILSLKG